ncbi:MAG: hypothetical protein GF329_09255, partial [Candidatus Lokiarchaeota archaeon]|nr:hypothetical protein [Candidatus Lokiarchaeota archaeon]
MVRKIKIIIKSVDVVLEGEIYDTPTANAIWDALPFSSNINTWGDEIYFDIPVTLDLEPDARADVEVGEIGYWDVGKSLCVFWGKTPASKNNGPVAASPVNVFGKVIGDPTVLN